MAPQPGFGGQPIFAIAGDKSKSDIEKIETLAHEFESLFMSQMIKSMRSTVEKSGLVDGGSAEELYTQMLDEQLARQMAFNQKSGLSDKLVEQLTSLMNRKTGETGEKGR